MTEMTSAQIQQLLDSCPIGRLCMAAPDGRPYSIPLPFCWDRGALYLRVPLTGRKGQILSTNDQVCFEVDQFTPTLDDYASVLIEGRLVEVVDPAEKARIKQINDARYDRLRRGHRPGHGRATPLDALPLRKIAVTQLAGRAKEPRLAVAAPGGI
jgi:nitroimidazol reductase NimA-like FMN-containing flavoprotein (pyridoxamine 5'-phosphate oxidase superfamily)